MILASGRIRRAAHRLTCVWQMAESRWHFRSERSLSCLTHTGPPAISYTSQHCLFICRFCYLCVCVCVFASVGKEQRTIKITWTLPRLSIIGIHCEGFNQVFLSAYITRADRVKLKLFNLRFL